MEGLSFPGIRLHLQITSVPGRLRRPDLSSSLPALCVLRAFPMHFDEKSMFAGHKLEAKTLKVSRLLVKIKEESACFCVTNHPPCQLSDS